MRLLGIIIHSAAQVWNKMEEDSMMGVLITSIADLHPLFRVHPQDRVFKLRHSGRRHSNVVHPLLS